MSQPRKASASRKPNLLKVSAAFIGAGLGGTKIEGGDRAIGRSKGYDLTGQHWWAYCPCCTSAPLGIEDVSPSRVRFHRLCACGPDRIVLELIRRGLWPDTTVDEDRGLNHRPKPKKPVPEAKGVADPAPGAFLKLRRDGSASAVMAVLSPLGSWVLLRFWCASGCGPVVSRTNP